MNRCYLIRRIRGPILLLTFGVTAILDRWHVLDYGQSWPLYLIVLGVLGLAERAALAQQDMADYATGQPPSPPYLGPYQGREGR